MTLADALLADVIANPADDTPRLVYADWLDENGHESRAEFIRVQIEMWRRRAGPAGLVSEDSPWLANDAAYQFMRRREWELLDAALRDLPRAFRAAVPYGAAFSDHLSFRRGFVASVTLPCAGWLAHGPALVRAAPLEEVRLSDAAMIESRDGRAPARFAAAFLRDFLAPSWWPQAFHPTAEAAWAALSAACLARARAAG